MPKNKLHLAALAAGLGIVSMIGPGCSDGTITQYSSDSESSGIESISYLPVTEGYTTAYQVSYSDGTSDIVTLEIGHQVQIGGVTAWEWIGTTEEGTDIGYVRVSDGCAYFYETPTSPAERILALPLDNGQSWERFDGIDDNNGGFTDIITSLDDDDEGTVDGDALSKSFPTVGGEIMTVAGRETVEMVNGTCFVNAVKIYNEGTAPGKTNYYWFVANVGLVKYVLGATDRSYPNGDVVAVLFDYGT